TCTAPGARLLADWLARPLATLDAIAARHDAVTALVGDDRLRADLREALRKVYDLERLCARIATGRAGPRDITHLALSLRGAARCGAALADIAALPALLGDARRDIGVDGELEEDIAATLVDDPPIALADGGVVRDGVDEELDRLRGTKRD